MAAAKAFEAYVPGLNALMRELRGLDKESQGKLRDASTDIANRYMVPAWRNAAMNAGAWGPGIASSIKAKRDRLPAISIGGNRKTYSGGASPTMVRYPSHAGRIRESIPAAFITTAWMDAVKPAYIGDAMRAWGQAVDQIVSGFNNGPDY